MTKSPTSNTNNADRYPVLTHIEDEISLIDLVTVLIRRKKTVYWVFSIIILLGLLFTFLSPEKYLYSTTIEIGQRIEKEEIKLIDETETLLAKIKESYIPLALQAYYKAHGDDEKIYEIKASIPKKSHIIVLSSKGTEKEADIFKSLSQAVVNEVVLDHGRLINIIKKNHELEIKLIENDILSMEQQAGIYKADLLRVDKNTVLIKNQIKNIKSMVNDGIVNRKKASRNVKSESSAMTLLLIDNETQQNRDRLDGLEERLIVVIDNEKDVLNKSLSDLYRNTLTRRDEVALKKIEIENIRDTRALIVGLKSLEPVNTSKRVLLLMFIFVGAFIALIAAFIHEFVFNVKNALTIEQ